VNVEVLPEDIAGGRRGDECQCPAARAIARIAQMDAYVDGITVIIHDPLTAEEREYVLNPVVRQIVDDYDCGWGMYPFGFTMEES
jgi:hypothetical protein